MNPHGITIIAPANSMADMRPDLVAMGVARLRDAGYTVSFGQSVNERHYYLAGTLEQRLSDLHAAFADPNGIILPVFGGYNCNQLLPYLDYDQIRTANKTIIGYSDITALLVAIATYAGTPTIHGPTFSVLCDPNLFEYTWTSFRAALCGEHMELRSPAFVADDIWYRKPGFGPRETRPFGGWKIYCKGEAEGPLIGGNLDTLTSLAGTRFFPETEGCLLFLEDTSGAAPGLFHRQLTQLRQIGALEPIAGLIIGLMPGGSALDDASMMTCILDDVLLGLRYPVVYDVNCSHVDPMLSLPLRAPATLIADGAPRLEVGIR